MVVIEQPTQALAAHDLAVGTSHRHIQLKDLVCQSLMAALDVIMAGKSLPSVPPAVV